MSEFSHYLQFIPGLPKGPGPWLFVTVDGLVHAGELLWKDSALAASGQTRVLRTTNPTDGVHEVYDIPASQVVAHAYARAGLGPATSGVPAS